MPQSINLEKEEQKIVVNRLLLAKNLFLHGLDHSHKIGALNKMIGVHNFHNAIEVVLKAIILHYKIRAEKELNIGFETMLNEIDNFPEFKNAHKKLPYRQEIRNLNLMRNLVQHHGVEPADSTMDEWRVFTSRFLEKSFRSYFDREFAQVSLLSLIEDIRLHKILTVANSQLEKEEWKKAISLSKLAFEYASRAILECFPMDSFYIRPFSISPNPAFFMNAPEQNVVQWVENAKKDIRKEIRENTMKANSFSALLSTGLNLSDYARFRQNTPIINFNLEGKVLQQFLNDNHTEEEAFWIQNFVVNSIIHWQLSGFVPKVPAFLEEGCDQFIIQENDGKETNENATDSQEE